MILIYIPSRRFYNMKYRLKGVYIFMEAIFRTSRKERVSFALFMAGQALYNTLFNGFGQVFMTDMGITAATVGTIFLLTRIFDAVNDPIFGGIMDRSHLKSGKFLPWLRMSIALLAVLTLAFFLLPGSIPTNSKIAWAAVVYVMYSVAYTIGDVPIFSMISAITDQVQERVQIQSRNSMSAFVAMLMLMLVVPVLYPKVGWALTALILVVPAILMMIPMARNAKERYLNKSEEPVTLKSMFHFIKNNRYLVLFFLGVLVMNMTNTAQSSIVYFTTNNLGNPELTAVLSLFLAVPALAVAAVLPRLTKRFDKFQIFITCIVGMLIMSVITFFVGYENRAVFYGMTVLRGFFWGGIGIMTLMFTSDFIEYGEFKTGKRLQGTAYSIQTFICKLMTALSSAACMFVLAIAGFKSGAGAVQSETAKDAIWILFSVLPAFGAFLSLLIFRKYKLRDKDVQLMAKANAGDITRNEAEQAFSRPY